MLDYRRAFVPGGTFFFTLVTERRAGILCDPHARLCLREALRTTPARWPFEIRAIVLLPDHLHTIWSLPERGAFREFERHSRIGMVSDESFAERVARLCQLAVTHISREPAP